MIRTKEQLVVALSGGKRLSGSMGVRPSAPWKYKVGEVPVHGNAFRSAEKAGLLSCIVDHWNHTTHVLIDTGRG